MPREHAQISLGDAELRTFLASFDRLVLATLAGDGTWGDAVAYGLADDRVVFHVPDGTRSLRNIRGDDRVCCTVESHPKGTSYYDIKAAMVHGHAVEHDPATLDPDLLARLRAVPDPVTHRTVGAGAFFSVDLDDVVSFAFEKIAYRYEDRTV